MPEEAAQRRREREANDPLDLELPDPAEDVLDRVLRGDDLEARVEDLVERRVEGHRLARPRGPAVKDQPVRRADWPRRGAVHL